MNNLYHELNIPITQDDNTLLVELLKYAHIAKYRGTYDMISDNEVFFQTFLRDSQIDFMNTPLFMKISKLFAPIQGFDISSKAQVVKITDSLIPHIDARGCVFTIPLSNTSLPITWYNDDGSILEQYYYTKPVLINTHVTHGCLENIEDRYLLQIGVDSHFGDFEYVKMMIGE